MPDRNTEAVNEDLEARQLPEGENLDSSKKEDKRSGYIPRERVDAMENKWRERLAEQEERSVNLINQRFDELQQSLTVSQNNGEEEDELTKRWNEVERRAKTVAEKVMSERELKRDTEEAIGLIDAASEELNIPTKELQNSLVEIVRDYKMGGSILNNTERALEHYMRYVHKEPEKKSSEHIEEESGTPPPPKSQSQKIQDAKSLDDFADILSKTLNVKG